MRSARSSATATATSTGPVWRPRRRCTPPASGCWPRPPWTCTAPTTTPSSRPPSSGCAKCWTPSTWPGCWRRSACSPTPPHAASARPSAAASAGSSVRVAAGERPGHGQGQDPPQRCAHAGRRGGSAGPRGRPAPPGWHLGAAGPGRRRGPRQAPVHPPGQSGRSARQRARAAMTATLVPPARPTIGGERFARRTVTWCGVLVGLACFGFSFGNVLALGRHLEVPGYVAWLVAPAVDLTLVGLIVGIRHLSLRGVEGRRLRPGRLLLVAAGLATLALNTAHGLFVRRHLGVVAYDSLAPLLLIGWAEVGPWFLRQFAATVSDVSTSAPASTEPAGPSDGASPPVGPGR